MKALEEAEQTLRRWRGYALHSDRIEDPPRVFIETIEDDLNTPEATTKIHSLTRIGVIPGYSFFGQSSYASTEEIERSSSELRGCLQLLGLSRVCEPDWNRPSIDDAQRVEIETFVARRNDARAARNWAESDRIRAELDAMGIALKDNKDGTTTWEPKQ